MFDWMGGFSDLITIGVIALVVVMLAAGFKENSKLNKNNKGNSSSTNTEKKE